MPREQEFSADNVMNNQMAQLDADFAQTIRELHASLSTAEASPVWTGFLASSWKVRRNPIDQIDRVEDHEPWAGLKREASEEFFKTGKSSRPKKPKIEPRFPIGEEQRIFNYRRPVYIGNKAVYSIYVLESGSLQRYLGGLGKKIKRKMTDKGKVRFGQRYTTKGFGSVKPKTIIQY